MVGLSTISIDNQNSKDWKIVPLTKTVDYIHGKAHEQHIDPHGKYVVVNSKFIASNGIVRKYSRINFQPAKKGDVLTVLSDVPNGKALAKCFFVDESNLYAVNQRICIWRNKGMMDSKFLFYLLNRHKYFIGLDDGISQTHILNKDIEDCEVFIPPTKAEQSAIANALSDMDELIEGLEKLIEKKKRIKEGVMQELLKPKEGWNDVKVKQLGSLYGGLSGKSKKDFGSGNSRYIPFLNVMNNVRIDFSYLDKVSVRSGESQNLVRKGDLLFNGSSETPEELGLSSFVHCETSELYLNSFCFGLRIKDSHQFNGLFLAYFFRSHYGREILSSLAQGSTRYNLSKSNFKETSISIPNPSEQGEISSILVDLDHELVSLREQLGKFEFVKEGMMQDLLTGKKRLI